MCYHLTNVDTQLSKFVVILASVARQIHRRPLPPIPRRSIERQFKENGSHHSLEPTPTLALLAKLLYQQRC